MYDGAADGRTPVSTINNWQCNIFLSELLNVCATGKSAGGEDSVCLTLTTINVQLSLALAYVSVSLSETPLLAEQMTI